MSSADLTQGRVATALLRVAAPMSLGVLSIMLTGLADAFFLGRYGQEELAAIGFVYPVIIAVTSLGIGLSAGVNSVLSRAIGADAPHRRLAFHGLLVSGAIGVAIAAVLAAIHPRLLALMGAEGAVLDAATDYFFYWQISFPFLAVTMASAAVLRAHGDGGRPAAIMVFEAVANVALTPVLVFGYLGLPELGAAGAGLATMIARVASMSVSLGVQVRQGHIGSDGLRLEGFPGSALRIMKIAVPAAGSNAINPAGLAFVTTIVAGFGDAAVAGFGAAGRVQSFLLVPLLALSAGISPVVGQNWGAGETGRSRAAVGYALAVCAGYGLMVGLGLALLAPQAAGLMTASAEAAGYMTQYLRVVGWTLFGYGVVVVLNAAMNARDRAGHSLGLSLSRIALVYVPLAWALSAMLGYTGVVVAAAVANLAGAALGLVLAARVSLLPSRRGMRDVGLTRA